MIDIISRSIPVPQEMASEALHTPRAWGDLRCLNSLVSEASEERESCSQDSLPLSQFNFHFSFSLSPTDSTTCSSAKSKVSAKAILAGQPALCFLVKGIGRSARGPEEGCWSLGRRVGRSVCMRSAEKLLTLAVLREVSGGREGSGLGVRRPGGSVPSGQKHTQSWD